MTTPRVTVPVEPTEARRRLELFAGGASIAVAWSDNKFDAMTPFEAIRADLTSMLSAAPAPEGGAVAIPRHVADLAASVIKAYAPDERLLLEALATREAEAGELKADFSRSHPSGMDDCTYEQIEFALDRADAPINGPDGKFLTLAQRVEALRAQPPARSGEGQ